MLKRLLAVATLSCAYFAGPLGSSSVVHASNACDCYVDIYAYNASHNLIYSTNDQLFSSATSNSDCASNVCQIWVVSRGSDICDATGATGVNLVWDWSYWTGSTWQFGHLDQGFACADI